VKDDATSIFILGAGVMQLPAIRAAKAMGWRVIAADGSREAEGVPYADRFEHVDLKDRDAMTAAVKKCMKDGGVDGVFTAGTDFSATVAWVAEQCGLPGLAYETALDATDKGRMRRKFREHGVPQPDFMELAEGDDPRIVPETLPFPLVVKPVDNMGARGVKRIDTMEALTESFAAALTFSRAGRVIVEEYVAGPEFSLDALVYGGKPTLCGLAERHIFFEPYFVEMGHTMPAVLDEPTKAKIAAVFFQGIRALGIDAGAAKGDIKLSARGPMVGEIAARLSGGYMSGWTYPYATGVEVTRSALRIAVGLPPDRLAPREHSFSAERAFISLPGVIRRLSGLDEAKAVPGVKDLFLRVREGAAVEFPKNNVQKCGNVITKGASRKEAVDAAAEALARIFIRLEPARPETDAFLRGETPPPFGALRLAVPENRAAYERLPEWLGDPDCFDPDRPRILDLPRPADEKTCDWHGLPLGRLLEIVISVSGACFIPPLSESGFALGKIFWRAFLKGGAQGAVYLLDTLREKAGRPGDWTGLLKEGKR
jgi:biotin carboxylase